MSFTPKSPADGAAGLRGPQRRIAEALSLGILDAGRLDAGGADETGPTGSPHAPDGYVSWSTGRLHFRRVLLTWRFCGDALTAGVGGRGLGPWAEIKKAAPFSGSGSGDRPWADTQTWIYLRTHPLGDASQFGFSQIGLVLLLALM